ncbi:MAG: hypothetical protein Q9163_006058 [Psora crenata]
MPQRSLSRFIKLTHTTSVRSFDNTRSETIQFNTPLTLIVGYNGSGKTTIIECLKYATTGDLPPNSKGGAFIHDPKLCGEREVLAQVKMSFKSTSQVRMVVTRSLQLTVKKTARQQKTLEGQLLMVKDGERSSISSRVAELDLLMPQNLGVSKAILESVIFCHQDESLWPMSEPGSLKKKFDEIFEALKYTKAIDNIKQLRKKHGEKLQSLKVAQSAARENKLKGDKAEKRSKELDAELKVLRSDIMNLRTEIERAKEKVGNAWDQRNRYQNVLDTLQLRQEKERWLQDAVQGQLKGLRERTESDEWLQTELDNYQERVKVLEDNQGQQKKEYARLDEVIREAREKLSRKHGDLGKHEQKKVSYGQQIEHRKNLIKETSRRHNIRGYDSNLDDGKIDEYIRKIATLSTNQSAAVEAAAKECEREMEKMREHLRSLGEQKSKLIAEKNSSKQQLTANDEMIRRARSELTHLDVDEGEIAIIESKIEQLELDLKRAREESDAALCNKTIQEHDVYLRLLEEEVNQLNDELIKGTKRAGDVAQLDHLRKELADRQRSLDKLKGVHEVKLQVLLKHEWQPSRLDADFSNCLDDKAQQLGEAERQRAMRSRDLEQIDYEIGNNQRSLEDGQNERDACEKRLREIIERPEGYPTELADIQEGRDVLKSDADGFVHLRGFYEQAITLAYNRHKCRLCMRGFNDSKEVEQFVNVMKKKMKEEDFVKTKSDLAAQEDLLHKAKEVGPAYITWVRLTKTDLPRLESTAKDLSLKRSTALRELEELDHAVNERELARAEVYSLGKPVANITKYDQEIAGLSAQIQDMTGKQTHFAFSRSLEEVHQQLDAVKKKSKDAVREKDKLSADKERLHSKISTIELELVNAKGNLSNANHQLEKRTAKLRQIEDLYSGNDIQRNMIRKLDDQLRELTSQIEEEQDRLDDIKQRGRLREATLRDEASKLVDSVYRLNESEKAIRSYVDGGGDADMARCQEEIERTETYIQSTDQELKKVIKSLNKCTEELTTQGETRRTIEDNIRYRRCLRELEAIRTEIADLSAQNATADQQHWRDEADRWQQKLNMLSTQQTSKLGAAKAKDDQLASLIEDWNTDYKDAAHNYKKAHIEVETTKAAVEDLGRYGGALDKAIMKYHSIKMEEINRIIGELWRKTYQGTDVDTILIRSDNEAAKGNRSYNYRVSMIKQDAEMDMRGRCSAGQKVLASIIIRLALAECFGVNCGLIALDEPTTNLDRDNIRSLAQSLHDIIQTRRHQANFQLIVITHDEEFLRFMKCPDFCDNYYRISRNDREKSIIEQQSIAEVM